MTTMRESSRKEFGSDESVEHINLGSLQRIADACELMARNFLQLQADRDLYKRWHENVSRERDREKRRSASLRGVITKLKRAKP